MKHLRRLTSATIVLSLFCSVALVDGTSARDDLSGKLTAPLTTASASVGDGFRLRVTRPYPDHDQRYEGATVEGHVAAVVRAAQGRKALLRLAFDAIVLADGTKVPVRAHVVRVSGRNDEATSRVFGHALRSVVGRVVAKVAGTNVSGSVGAAAGLLYAANQNEDLTVPADVNVVLHLEQPGARALAQADDRSS